MEPIKKYRYKLIVEYDGSSYHGFQFQNENHIKTIEGQLQKAFKYFTQNEIEIFASGRTDSGVHAIAQTIHVDLSQKFSSHQIIMGLNFYLKDEEIAVIDAEIVAICRRFLYGMPVNETTLTLVKHELPQTFPEKILTEAGPVTVFNPGFPVHWHVDP